MKKNITPEQQKKRAEQRRKSYQNWNDNFQKSFELTSEQITQTATHIHTETKVLYRIVKHRNCAERLYGHSWLSSEYRNSELSRPLFKLIDKE